ncbi:hypothetical protein CRENBAI_002827, partial [Crenichthys baileyi]
MVRWNLGQSTRSIYVGLACISLTLHILMAFFCLSVLQSACILPTSSSSTSSYFPRIDPVSHASSSSSASSSSNKQQTNHQHGERQKPNAGTFDHKGNGSFNEDTEKEKKLIGAGKMIANERGRSKLEELFKHSLYNLPRPELQQYDWLLRLKTDAEAEETEREEKAKGDSITSGSDWQSASEEEGYDKATWTREKETHPPWLRFHLGISRWELYDRKDLNLAQLTHYLATQRILGA